MTPGFPGPRSLEPAAVLALADVVSCRLQTPFIWHWYWACVAVRHRTRCEVLRGSEQERANPRAHPVALAPLAFVRRAQLGPSSATVSSSSTTDRGAEFRSQMAAMLLAAMWRAVAKATTSALSASVQTLLD